MNTLVKLFLFVAAFFMCTISAECEASNNLAECVKYIKDNKVLYCNTTDYECLCSWDTQMVTCFSICPDEDDLKTPLSDAMRAQNKTCQAFLDWTKAVIKPTKSLLDDEEKTDVKPTSGVDNSNKGRKGDEKLSVAKSASSSLNVHASVLSLAAIASIALTILV